MLEQEECIGEVPEEIKWLILKLQDVPIWNKIKKIYMLVSGLSDQKLTSFLCLIKKIQRFLRLFVLIEKVHGHHK